MYWAETGKKRGAVALVATPISVGESLAQNLIEPLDACVMTSATMSVGRNFSFIRRELGLDELERERLKEMIVPSPFDYRSPVSYTHLNILLLYSRFVKLTFYLTKDVVVGKTRNFCIYHVEDIIYRFTLSNAP